MTIHVRSLAVASITKIADMPYKYVEVSRPMGTPLDIIEHTHRSKIK